MSSFPLADAEDAYIGTDRRPARIIGLKPYQIEGGSLFKISGCLRVEV